MLDEHFLETIGVLLELQLPRDVSFMVVAGLIVALNQEVLVIFENQGQFSNHFADPKNGFQVIVDSLLNIYSQNYSNLLIFDDLLDQGLKLFLQTSLLLGQDIIDLLKISDQLVDKQDELFEMLLDVFRHQDQFFKIMPHQI